MRVVAHCDEQLRILVHMEQISRSFWKESSTIKPIPKPQKQDLWSTLKWLQFLLVSLKSFKCHFDHNLNLLTFLSSWKELGYTGEFFASWYNNPVDQKIFQYAIMSANTFHTVLMWKSMRSFFYIFQYFYWLKKCVFLTFYLISLIEISQCQ